eukprot:6414513-Ditylum_brightwellii.AAC.1
MPLQRPIYHLPQQCPPGFAIMPLLLYFSLICSTLNKDTLFVTMLNRKFSQDVPPKACTLLFHCPTLKNCSIRTTKRPPKGTIPQGPCHFPLHL